MKKDFMVGWVYEYSNKFSIKAKKSLMRILINTSLLRNESITVFLDQFLLEAKKYKNMVIWFKLALCYTLVIKPEGIKLLKNYEDIILDCTVQENGKRLINEKITTEEGLAVVVVLFIEMLKNKTAG